MVKSSGKKKSGYKKNKRQVVSKAVQKYVQKAIYKTPEKQYKDSSVAKTELYHNVFFTPIELTAASRVPTQGDGSGSFSGGKFKIQGFNIRCLFGQKADRPNVTFRVSFFDTTGDTSLSYNTIFSNITGNVLLDPLHQFNVRNVKEFWIKPYKGTMDNATDEITFTRSFYVPYSRVFNNGNNNSKHLYMMVHVYDAYGSLVTDNVAYFQSWISCGFRDF